MNNYLFVIPFHAKIKDNCDYAVQTLKIVSQSYITIGIALGDPCSLLEIIKDLFLFQFNPIIHIGNSVVIRPIGFIPGQRIRFIKKINYDITCRLVVFYIQLFFRHKQKFVWFFEPLGIPAFLSLFNKFQSIYDCVDYFPPLSKEWENDDTYFFKSADYTFVNSYALKKVHDYAKNVIVVPLGFDSKLFKKPLKNKTHFPNNITIGYIGGINYRFNYSLLLSLIQKRKNDQFVFVGPIQTGLVPGDIDILNKFKFLRQHNNVHWKTEVIKEQIPSFLHSFDVCIIPYDTHFLFNKYCHPMKLLEYFAAGKPVITTSIEEMKRYKDLVFIADTAEEFDKRISQIRKTQWPVSRINKQYSVAYEQRWEVKIQTILDNISK